MHVLIATPTAGNIVQTAYVQSIVAATQVIRSLNGYYAHMTFDGADVVMARNYIAEYFMKAAEYTHLLFLDSDMLVSNEVFSKLLRADKELAGCIYSERAMNREFYRAAIAKGADETKATAAAMRFNVKHAGTQLKITNGWCRVAGIGCGCMLVDRSVFQRIADSGHAKRVTSKKMAERTGIESFHDYFDLLPAEDGDHFSEDYSFCERARRAGIDVWGLADLAVGHVGQQVFSAPYQMHLEMRAARR